MAKTISLYIEEPFASREVAVEWLSVETPSGSFIVGSDHRPMISLVSSGESVTYFVAGTSTVVPVSEGGALLQVTGSSIYLVLC